MPPPAIQTSGLSKTYQGMFGRNKVNALSNVSLDVAKGEIVGILGPNGAGKTTLLKILLGVVSPTAGSATLLGKAIGDPSARARLGYLPENHRFPPYLTARQTLDVYGRLSRMDQAALKKRIPFLVEQAGLSSWIDTRVGKFSKGMMQRLGLAQATINNPDILVLDEPTDGVDPVGRREIRDRLRALKAEGTTILINSHLLTEIELICDRVAILNKGSIIQTGSISDLSGIQSGWRIECSGAPSSLELTGFDVEIENDGSLVLSSGSIEDLNRLIDTLRSRGVTIISIERHRKSLETSFLDLLDAKDSEDSTQVDDRPDLSDSASPAQPFNKERASR